MAQLINDPAKYLHKHLGRKGKVLLINPPVQEKRYHWIQWNQPLELLRLSSSLKRSPRCADVRLFDFMFPDPAGQVPKTKAKDTFSGASGEILWHFGQPFSQFDEYFVGLLQSGWVPNLIVVSSLTSYWHISIEKLLVRMCNLLGARYRKNTQIIIYGAYPCIEPEHAETQTDADVAFTCSMDLTGCAPDFALYIDQWQRPPKFYALDVEDPDVADHMKLCVALTDKWSKSKGLKTLLPLSMTFFNDDLFGQRSQIEKVVGAVERLQGRVEFAGICGLQPSSLSCDRLEMLLNMGFRSLFVEYATHPDGSLNEEAYKPLRELLYRISKRKKGKEKGVTLNRDPISAFINVGLPSDNLEAIVRNTLLLNSYFRAIIIKPFGYSPDIDSSPVGERRSRWPLPAYGSPQWFPYAGHSSALTANDYNNLMRWQGVLNMKVKGYTFDFLGNSSVPRLVRETLIEETWKRRQ